MKKIVLLLLIAFIFAVNTSFKKHKFYVSIYQIEQNVAKKRLEITARIFIDDLNKVLSKQHAKKISICEPLETIQDIDLLEQYLIENITITINGKIKPIVFKTKELETNVVVCYLNCNDVGKIKKLLIKNTALLTLNAEQQNIIQIKINNQKRSLLLTNDNSSEMLNF